MDIELYDFNEHMTSIEWISELPTGLVNQQIDTRYNNVSITKFSEGFEVYISPKDMDAGGDTIMITLDINFQLIDYVIERIETLPFD
jgi:hypothetical protein